MSISHTSPIIVERGGHKPLSSASSVDARESSLGAVSPTVRFAQTAVGPTKTTAPLESTAILCRGNLRLSRGILDAGLFRQRFFALVVFDGSAALPKGASAGNKVDPTAGESGEGERTVVLVWLATEAAFASWFAKLEPSKSVKGAVCMAAGAKPAVAACLGHVPIRGIRELRETLRLDLPTFSTFELVTASRTLLLASEASAEIGRWESSLLAEMDEHAHDKVARYEAAGRASVNRRASAAHRRASTRASTRASLAPPASARSRRFSLPRFSIFAPSSRFSTPSVHRGVVGVNKWTYEV